MQGNIGRVFMSAAAGILLCSAVPSHASNQVIGSATGGPGDVVTIDVTLQPEGDAVAGTENVISFDSSAQIVSCARNEAIGREATNFSFRPSGCTAGTDCTSVKALVLSFSNLDAIPDGSVLYSCDVQLPGEAGCWPLTCESPGASDPTGNALTATCTDGEVCVEVAPTETATPLATDTPVPTATKTKKPGGGGDDDGCQIAAPASGHGGWFLLIPALGLLWLRRRAG